MLLAVAPSSEQPPGLEAAGDPAVDPLPPGGVHIHLLGGFGAWRGDGTAITGLGRRTVALLTCLAVSREPWMRDELAALLWHGRSREQMRGSLRQELLRLRRCFGWNAVDFGGTTATLSLPCGLAFIDVVRLRHALAEPAGTAEVGKLYRGVLLQGFPAEPQDAFSDWLARERARLHAAALDAMLRLLCSGEGSEALVQRILALEPGCEEAHRFLMRQHAAQGDLDRVLAQYRACATALQGEPSAATRAVRDEAVAAFGSAAASPNAVSASGRTLDWIRSAPDRAPVPAIPAAQPLPFVEDRPSIAVLPFQDLSLDPLVRGILAEGMTEEVTHALARMPGFFVTARQSAMAYRGLPLDVRRIAAELGVRYLIEGSVEQDGRRMRANLRLVDGRTGLHLWSDTQGGPIHDAMAVRDTMVRRIASRLEPRLVLEEIQRAFRRPPGDLDAWTWLQRANGMLLRGRSRLALEQVLEPLGQALRVDPDYAMAHALLSAVHTWRALSLVSPDPRAERQLAQEHAELALRKEPDNPFVLVHCAEAAIYSAADIDAGLALLELTGKLDPNDANGLALLGHVRRFAGQDPQASLALIDEAIRLSPRDPRTFSWHLYANWCHWQLGDLEGMEAAGRRSLELYGQNVAGWIALAGALALQERLDEAREAASVLRRLRPGFTPDRYFDVLRKHHGEYFKGKLESDCRQLCAALNRIW